MSSNRTELPFVQELETQSELDTFSPAGESAEGSQSARPTASLGLSATLVASTIEIEHIAAPESVPTARHDAPYESTSVTLMRVKRLVTFIRSRHCDYFRVHI